MGSGTTKLLDSNAAWLMPMAKLPWEGAKAVGLVGGGRGESQNAGVAPPAVADPLDASSVAARRRAARRMSDGMRSTFQTSTRGTEAKAGTGLAPRGEDEPIITSMTDVSLAGVTPAYASMSPERQALVDQNAELLTARRERAGRGGAR